MIEMDVAKPFRILSAYLMTAAMTNPPNAYKKHAVHVYRIMTTNTNMHDCV